MPRRRNGRAAAATVSAPIRCAVYTRKSTSAGLDRDFTSIDNQRQICERFVEQMDSSVLLPERFDDGGYSGGTIDRPALQRLLEAIRGGLVDCVIAYKYDRLGRSMIDCLRIFELFEKHNVRFISVTQQIDTSTSHGRLFVNNLLMHAQFERDLISERTRDKLAAARRRGDWTGGFVPLGYDTVPEGGRLVVNKAEAEQVRAIFALYLEHRSLVKLAQELGRRGWRRKTWTAKTGKVCGGKPWDRASLSLMLRKPLYIGLQRLGDETFPGKHRAIVPKKLWSEVQEILDGNWRSAGAANRNGYAFLLRGLLRCAGCDAAMTPHPTKKKDWLYRYYTCRAAQKRGHGTCTTKSVRADDIENFVVEQIRRIGADADLQRETFRQAQAQLKAERRGLKAEARRLERDLGKAKKKIAPLVAAITDANGSGKEALHAELDTAQRHVTTLETRLGEIDNRLADLDAQTVNEADVARALEAFDPIWDVLLTAEKERVLKLLIERVDYSRETGDLTIAWRLAGLAEFGSEVIDG